MSGKHGKGGQIHLFEGYYRIHRLNRINLLLDVFGHRWFQGKKILEAGAGFGHISGFFDTLGARMEAYEGRIENIIAGRNRHPRVKFTHWDFNKGLPGKRYWDMILHMGLLYHLHEDSIKLNVKHCLEKARHVVIDTNVSAMNKNTFHIEMPTPTRALDGKAYRPSVYFLENIFKAYDVDFERYDIPELNVNRGGNELVYDWKPEDASLYDPDSLRRFWIIKWRK